MTGRQITNDIILTGGVGEKTVHGEERDLPEANNFVKGRINGNQSFYIVYSAPNYYEGTPLPPGVTPISKIVNSQTDVTFGFKARSTQGWDKVGITLFGHRHYCGTGRTCTDTVADITSMFPSGQPKGACSFIIMRGVWALYTAKNYSEESRIKINGQVEFGPGCFMPELEGTGYVIQSIKHLRDN